MREPAPPILTALAARRPHGYGIVQSVIDLSAGEVALRPGIRYGALDRQGLIAVDREEPVDGRLRDSGAAALAEQAERRRATAADTQLGRRPGVAGGAA